MAGHSVVVLGMGKTGLACVDYLYRQGVSPLVVDSRENPPGLASLPADVARHCGDFPQELLCRAKTLVVSPGISLKQPAIEAARASGVEIIGDIELFARANRVPVIGITGSNGKSTVTTLVGLMAEKADLRVGVAGNIGTPVLSLLEESLDLCVLELSSFQLETTFSLSCQAATVLNLSEDHMDRYLDIEDYRAAKLRIYRGAQAVISNRQDLRTYPLEACPDFSFGSDNSGYGLLEVDGECWLAVEGEPVMNTRDMGLLGRHNQLNALAAMALADRVGIQREAQLAALREFSGLAYRCELVANKNGVLWVNDSKATNVGATIAAIEGLEGQYSGRLFLLAGGQGKGQDFSPLEPLLNHQVHQTICFGEDGDAIAGLTPQHHRVDSLEQAIDYCSNQVCAGDLVLLAPACASFDQFVSFEARGARFNQLVELL
ncbi:UDP-N-acetylmuramoyl-L-alanine--D-glutamate ligase [Dongshaea marina]|uniref:UDP-N-acetylmuramoyl-L-alanine--D-glutamate ligase n=1 Tax=Dongshaea marina TaxID=2047966 RepID=UPI000D3E31C2|nr:UDP-N-acetylmuramoyl-L-alanine--D-glutamate ligase [Dongshaea marina]